MKVWQDENWVRAMKDETIDRAIEILQELKQRYDGDAELNFAHYGDDVGYEAWIETEREILR